MPLTKEAVDSVVQITGLKPTTVRELLEAGWTFRSSLDGPNQWLDPSYQHRVMEVKR